MKAEIKGGSLVLRRRQKTVPANYQNRLASGLKIKLKSSNRQGLFWLVSVGTMVALMLLATLSLRQNNLTMVHLRADLVAKDETSDVQLVHNAAKKLQNYVAHHMNTSTGRIALQSLYNQAAERVIEKSKPADISSDVYQQATAVCKPQLVNYGYQAWASCIANKVGLNNDVSFIVSNNIEPDPDLYYIDYVAARWSVDVAGLALLALLVDGLIISTKLVVGLGSRFMHYCRSRR